jgi:hypothetical protein
MIVAVVGALVLALQATAPVEPAAAPPAATAPAPAPKPDDSQKIVCRNETVLGSIIPKRVCLTQANWDAARQAGQEYTKGVQSRALQGGDPSVARSH